MYTGKGYLHYISTSGEKALKHPRSVSSLPAHSVKLVASCGQCCCRMDFRLLRPFSHSFIPIATIDFDLSLPTFVSVYCLRWLIERHLILI